MSILAFCSFCRFDYPSSDPLIVLHTPSFSRSGGAFRRFGGKPLRSYFEEHGFLIALAISSGNGTITSHYICTITSLCRCSCCDCLVLSQQRLCFVQASLKVGHPPFDPRSSVRGFLSAFRHIAVLAANLSHVLEQLFVGLFKIAFCPGRIGHAQSFVDAYAIYVLSDRSSVQSSGSTSLSAVAWGGFSEEFNFTDSFHRRKKDYFIVRFFYIIALTEQM